MKIGLDFDGVLSDCGNLKREGALQLYGVDIPEEKFKTEIVVGEGILTLEQYRDLQKQIYQTKELGLQMKPVNGVFEYLKKLAEDGHELWIVTSRTEEGLEVAREWMKMHEINIPSHGCKGTKLQTCLELNLDIFVDDDLDKLEHLIGNVSNLFLFSWGYNKSVEISGSISRVKDWDHLYDKISSL